MNDLRLHSVCAVLGVALFMSSANAQVLVAPNNDGGEITLTTRDCELGGVNYTQQYPSLRKAYTYGDNTSYKEGCWTVIDGNVHVIYFHNNTRRVYPIDGFRKK
jgi:hypothetical protein